MCIIKNKLIIMKKLFLLGVMCLFYTYSFSQIHFEKGYFIDKQGKKTECLIKNMDWGYNPSEFKYKLKEDSETEVKKAEDINEFYVANQKYVSVYVKIDISSDNYQSLTNFRDPEFKSQRVLLKVLLEGKVNLYEYNCLRYTRYFIKDKGEEIKALIFKEYFKTPHIVAKNNQYQQDLWMQYRVEGIGFKDMKDIKYKANDLRKYFCKYNKSFSTKNSNNTIKTNNENQINNNIIYRKDKKKTDKFNLYLRSGLVCSSTKVNNISLPNVGTIKNNTDYRIELEAEFMLPFNKSKWAVFISPAYKSINIEENYDGNNGSYPFYFKYNSLEFQLGGRHYIYINEKSKLSLTAIIYTENIQKEYVGTKYTFKNEFRPRLINYKLALGYTYKNKYSFEVKYALPKNMIKRGNSGNLDYSELSISLGYNIF